MNYENYIKKIEIEAAALNQKEKVAIILICCIRLSPLYSKFSEFEDWGNESLLTQCRELAIDWFSSKRVNSNKLSKQVGEVIPDTEDFGTVLGSYALNAGVAHEYLLDQIKDNDPSFLIYVLRSCYDTVDLYVQECLELDCKGGTSESEIENHPAMVSEINWQLGIFNIVKGTKDLVQLIHGQDIEPILNQVA
ncbi:MULTISPECIES: DUF416 family protein [unclassified Halomonas]|uniref:DUF416 family protein n=1 Tax=unclassified Halomonas TaxID=2609666 RepID=UPI00403492B4